MVFYRKYRPQKIGDLDSQAIKENISALLSAPAGGSVPHALLFTGPKGLGKTSTARIVAKAVNCQRLASSRSASSSKEKKLNAKRYTLNASVEPCDLCNQCKSITNGSNVDVLEIDAASNRGIDEIRDLREKIRLLPVSAKMKVYIIDEVHMLTTEAFNALLKILEEPPAHAMFILCTTEPQKVPATIVSRCFHMPFRKATTEELISSFKRIVKGEKLSVDDEALSYIAKLSEGGFRDGAKILEEISLKNSGKKITKILVEKQFQTTGIEGYVSDLLDLLVKRDVKQALQLTEKVAEQGVDMRYFLEQLISFLHTALLTKIGIGEKVVGLRTDEIKELVELFSKAYADTKLAVIPQLPLELAIVTWCTGADETPVVSKDSKVEALEKKQNEEKPDGSSETWYKLIDSLKHEYHSVAGLLRGCRLNDITEQLVVIETAYPFHKEKLEEKKTRAVLETAWSDLLGKTVAISIILKEH